MLPAVSGKCRNDEQAKGGAPVQSLLQRVFPPGCTVVPAASVPKAQRFVVIPGDDGPRWIAPLDWNLSEKVLRQWSPIARISRAKWRLAMIAHRLQCIGHIPGAAVIGVANLDGSAWSQFGVAGDGDIVPVIYVARPSTTQKAVVSLLSAGAGEVNRVIKIALGSHAWSSLEREHANLEAVQQMHPGLAPRPLGLDPALGMTAQEWIEGEIRLSRPAEAAVNFLALLQQQKQRTTLRDLARRYHDRLAALPGREAAGSFARMLDSVRSDEAVPVAFYHGDFVSWNLICQDDGGCRAIDWEFSDRDGAPLLDLFHYLLRFPFAAGVIDSYRTAVRFSLEAHRPLIATILDRLGVSFRYAEDALTLSFVALYVTRHHQVSAIERTRPQLRSVAASFDSRALN